MARYSDDIFMNLVNGVDRTLQKTLEDVRRSMLMQYNYNKSLQKIKDSIKRELKQEIVDEVMSRINIEVSCEGLDAIKDLKKALNDLCI